MWRSLFSSILLAFAFSGDDRCPAYPESQRLSDRVQFQKERAAYAFSAQRANQQRHNALQLSTSNNFIDDYIFAKMVNDGVESAPLAYDAEIVRRLALDLTGSSHS